LGWLVWLRFPTGAPSVLETGAFQFMPSLGC